MERFKVEKMISCVNGSNSRMGAGHMVNSKLNFRGDISKIAVYGIPDDCLDFAVFPKEYAETLKAVMEGKNVDFSGIPGCGKSSMAKKLKRDLFNAGKDVYLLNFSDVFNSAKSPFDPEELKIALTATLNKIKALSPEIIIVDAPAYLLGRDKLPDIFMDFINNNHDKFQFAVFDYSVNQDPESIYQKDNIDIKLIKETIFNSSSLPRKKISISNVSDDELVQGTDLILTTAGYDFDKNILSALLEKTRRDYGTGASVRKMLLGCIDLLKRLNKTAKTAPMEHISFEDYKKTLAEQG